MRFESSYLCCRFPLNKTRILIYNSASAHLLFAESSQNSPRPPLCLPPGAKEPKQNAQLLPPAGWGWSNDLFCTEIQRFNKVFFSPVGPEWLWQFAIRGTLCPNEWWVLVQYFHFQSELRFKSPFFCRDAFRPMLAVAQITNVSLWQACVIADVWQYHLINHKERDNRNYCRMANVIIYIFLLLLVVIYIYSTTECNIYWPGWRNIIRISIS